MTSPKFVFCLMLLFLAKMVQTNDFIQDGIPRQDRAFISANVGDNVTLRCFFDSDAAKYYWYKQTLGQRPQFISVTYKFDTSGTFYDEFKDNPRFTLETNMGMNHLKISDLKVSDSATYFCAKGYSFMFEFSEGTTVSVKGSDLKTKAWVHQSASETVQPGDSVTLNCTVHTGTCDGEHSVYWFKESQEPGPGLIYTHGNKTDQCDRKQTNTCVYNLSMKNVTVSHAGTYYCAVALCGHVLYGNKTELCLNQVAPHFVVYVLSGVLSFTTILSVLLAFCMYKMSKKHRCTCSESNASASTPSTTNAEGGCEAENLHYAALNTNQPNRSRRKRDNSKNDCVYSSVRQ